MKNLSEALNDLIERASEGGNDAMVEAVAEDYGVHPKLLARKFTERTGRSIEDFRKVSTKIDYEARYNQLRGAMADSGDWIIHSHFEWADLTPAEKKSAIALMDRRPDLKNIVWTK